jgi:hypothetical protein
MLFTIASFSSYLFISSNISGVGSSGRFSHFSQSAAITALSYCRVNRKNSVAKTATNQYDEADI